MNDPAPARPIAPRWRDSGAGYVLAGIAVVSVLLLFSTAQRSPRHLACDVVDVSVRKSKVIVGDRVEEPFDLISLRLHISCDDPETDNRLAGSLRIGWPERPTIWPGFETEARSTPGSSVGRTWHAAVDWDLWPDHPSGGSMRDAIEAVLDSSRPVAVQFELWNGNHRVGCSSWIDLDRWRAKLSAELRRHR